MRKGNLIFFLAIPLLFMLMMGGPKNGCGQQAPPALPPDAELVRKKILAGELDVSGRPFLEDVLIRRWDELGAGFQDFLAANGLSSHLWIVARKSG